MHDQMLINVGATFAPLILSLGSVLFMARAYARRFSRCFALWTIAVWCTCELSLGFSLLLYLHSLEKHNEPIANVHVFIIALLLTLWLITSFMFMMNSLGVALISALVNFVVHFIFAGVVSGGTVAVLLSLVGTIWAGWTFLFCLSFVLYLRRKSMVRISDAVMNRMRVDSVSKQEV